MIFNILRQMLNIVNALWVYSDKTKWFIAKFPQVHVPLPHVFPPFAIRQSPTGRDTLGSRTLSDVASLCHSLRWCKKITAHPQLRTLVWCSALPSSSPLLLAFRLRKSECFYKNAKNGQSAKLIHNCEQSEQYHLP